MKFLYLFSHNKKLINLNLSHYHFLRQNGCDEDPQFLFAFMEEKKMNSDNDFSAIDIFYTKKWPMLSCLHTL